MLSGTWQLRRESRTVRRAAPTLWGAIGAVALLVALYVLASLPRLLKQRRCNHPAVNETQACDAICRECGKNLGFIKNRRDAQKAKGAA